ncbi:MAG TPA: DUF885 family protein [Terriglobales bacterium]|jgi:uncharacterized protein (DUF885 family)|nr:DUF885 family protein [Terriglobales bacterium]
MSKFLTLTLLCALICPLLANAQSSPNLESRRKTLNDLLAEQWEYTMRTSPLYASILGDKRWNDKLDDFSQQAIDNDLRQSQKFLDRFEAIDTAGFPEQEVLNKKLMVRDLKMKLDEARFKPWEMPVAQNRGIHLDAPQLVSVLSFESVKDYEDYISRLRQLPVLFDQNVVQMRKGMAEGLMPPRFLLEKVVVQANGIGTQPPDKSPFAQPFEKFPKAISEADQKRLREQGLAAIHDSVLPAYVKFAKFVNDEYAPKGRTEVGIWSLPDGDARYAFRVKDSTTTDLTPEEIHQLGLAQVKEIEGRMLAVANQLGYKDVKSFNAAIAKDPKLHAHSRQEILDLYRKYTDQMYPKLPGLFGRLPKAKLEIMPVEEFREKEASGAQYVQGTPDGSRPGHVMVNTGDFAQRSLLNIETTAYHEGVPGHHMQISIAQELPALPPFRQQEYYTAYTEGWALYSERLGKELGFYQDPYSYYGHLSDDMLRAIRLVVDTGIHYKHWTRQQVVDYFHEHSASDEPEVQSETDRYISWPGQALGYKIGQLEILKLRQYAKDQLGDKFDIRGFHDQVLGAGALPMDVLGDRIHEWVAQQKQNAGVASAAVASGN